MITLSEEAFRECVYVCVCMYVCVCVCVCVCVYAFYLFNQQIYFII